MDYGPVALGIGGFVLGGLFNYGIEWHRSVRERKNRKDDRRDDFQHATLVLLQQDLLALADSVGAAYQRVMLDEPLTDAEFVDYQAAEARFWVHYFNITNAETRAASEGYLAAVRTVKSAIYAPDGPSKPDIKAAFAAAGAKLNPALRAIGESLATL